MSIKVMNEVWESSNTAGTKRLMMVALADHANDEGYCYPSVIRLAVKCNCTERNAQILLRELEDTGELTVEVSAGRGNKSAYWVRPPATLDRLIVEYQEMLTRAKTNPEKVKFSALLEKVKNSAEKVKFSAEKVKNSAEKVKHISPKPYEPSEEPNRTISDQGSAEMSPEGDKDQGTSPDGGSADADHQGPASPSEEEPANTGDSSSDSKRRKKNSGAGPQAEKPLTPFQEMYKALHEGFAGIPVVSSRLGKMANELLDSEIPALDVAHALAWALTQDFWKTKLSINGVPTVLQQWGRAGKPTPTPQTQPTTPQAEEPSEPAESLFDF